MPLVLKLVPQNYPRQFAGRSDFIVRETGAFALLPPGIASSDTDRLVRARHFVNKII
jgi:hypothetical protein